MLRLLTPHLLLLQSFALGPIFFILLSLSFWRLGYASSSARLPPLFADSASFCASSFSLSSTMPLFWVLCFLAFYICVTLLSVLVQIPHCHLCCSGKPVLVYFVDYLPDAYPRQVL